MIRIGCEHGFRGDRSGKYKLWIVVPKGRCHAVSTGNAGHGGIAAHVGVVVVVRGSGSGRIIGTSVRITTGRHFVMYCEII